MTVVVLSYLVIMTLYYKMRQLFYYKVWQKFLTKCVRFFITKCDSYYKMRASILSQILTVITKCKFYYKMCWQNISLMKLYLVAFIMYLSTALKFVLDPLKLSEVFVSLFIVFSVILSTSSLSYVLWVDNWNEKCPAPNSWYIIEWLFWDLTFLQALVPYDLHDLSDHKRKHMVEYVPFFSSGSMFGPI